MGVEKYKKLVALTLIQCHNCKAAIVPPAPIILNNTAELETNAELLHTETVRQNSLLCGDPKLLIFFNEVLGDARLIQKEIIH